ncbi:hypothetical protein [Phyllobacterium leguminum]|uniref:Lipopolysaccharide export system protein LptA n=1 Tax=Phyllobacterium leguminum TaxID=314237 RepID=A0A318T942_9HYPH|nr:hypothetical protein [Phyllobacterium leguminum]PYE89988.1 hypothetical protein C7477_10275 [Phyllobacterium leguminum]
MMICAKSVPALFLGLAASAVSAGVSFAEENKTLPGVIPPKPIVTAPPPEPDRMTDPSRPNTVRIGNTDVTISGSITVDVGTMKSSRK